MPRIIVSIFVLACLMSGFLAACGNVNFPQTSSPSASTAERPVVEQGPSYETLVQGDFADPSIPRIAAENLMSLMDRGEKTIIIDNRNEYKFKQGHLAGAIHIEDAIGVPGLQEAMDKQLRALPDDALKVLYCD